MITKELCNGGKVRVTFSIPASIWADTIHLVGDFNNWSTTATPLKLDEVKWSVSLELEAGQAYHYHYLLNGQDWTSDWNTDQHVASDSGTHHSVVVTMLPSEAVATRPAWQRTARRYAA